MNKQIAVNSEKRTSFFRRSSLNAANLVSTLRASTGNSSASSSSKTQRHEVSFGLPEEDAVRSVAPGATATPIGQPTAMDGSSSPSASVPASELPVPQVPTICTSFSHGLSTINERRSMEDDSLQHQIEVLDGSRTSSSCSMPDYLCHKLHSVTVNVPTTHNDTEDQNGKHFRTALGPSVAPQETVQPSSSTSRFVKESCDSSTSTTTSESYQLSDLPPLPGNCKLATLNKPSSQALLASALRSRKARHSIDVRSLPSYLARKRQSTFGQFLSALSPTAPEESSSSDDPLFSEPVAPTLSLGERVAWVKSSGPEFGVVRWIGRMPQVTNDWTVGVEFDNPIGSGAGTVEGRRYFVAKENFAKFLPLSDLTKVDNYAGRPRSGTMLSRMSVQLKPGQLISIQRSPTTAPHCYLNAPHHVGHDVHSPNNRHCQCASCNHPCAHICKTRKPKGKRWTEDMAHMCHFSSKPHAHMCCGGEDLPSAAQPIMEAGVSWKHSEVIASLRTVPTEYHPRRKSVTIHARDTAADFKKSPRQDVLHSPSYIRDNCSSALLERTGSDLSISSLPSSSSVAEVYIGRSVLTDESDIDSETERSLESSSKASNKQGLRSLVACFLANSLRLKKSDKEKKETKPSRSNGGKRVKKSSRSEKDKFRSKQHRPLGLSSTDVSSYADIPSSAPNSQPLPSLSLDTSRHANEPINRPAVLFSSPRFASSNHVRNTKTSNRNSPYRKNDLSQAHNIDGHISEEVTNSSNSSAPRLASIDRADSRPSTNASTDNAASPRRRRHKGPAPKPPITAQCSSSPLSTTNNVSTSCPSSVPQSPTNSSVATSLSASSRNQGALTKSPAPLPPNLTRSLSEQKQLNMKNLINAMPSFRSEVNLQDMSKSDATQSLSEDLMQTRENEENILLVCEDGVSKLVQKEQTLVSTYLIDEMAKSNHVDDSIYQTPLPIKTLFNEIPPEIPAKTFDHIKIFGCNYNNETKRLEKRTVTDNVSSPNMPRSQSMPFSRYTCCQYHWKEYLNALSKTGQIIKYDHQQGTAKLAKHVAKLGHEPECDHKCLSFINHEESECDSEDDHECFMPSELMNALLSPQQSRRYKRSKDLSNKSNHESLDSTKANPSSVCNVFDRFEFIRALSDGSLTNTSTATVVEFINEDSSNGEGKPDLEDLSNSAKGNLNLLTEISPNDLLNNSNQKCLSDVFCQTNFEEPPERPSRQYKNHKCSCRCRHPKQRNHGQNRHFRHRQCAHHDCCSATQAMTCFGDDIRTASRNAWLTSSTSDHSLSSLSSSTSTLSEASTVRTSSTLSNDMSNCKSQHQCTSSMSPFVESLSHFTSADINFYSTADTLAELISGRSPISTERLFKSAENNFQPLVDAESNNEFSAFNQVHPKSSTTAQLENFAFDKKSSDIFEDLTSDMFMNQSFSLPSKLSNDQSLSEESKNKCLMSELEVAIANGNHQRAAILAKELAIKRVNCSLSGKLSNGKDKSTLTSPIVAYLYIEDRNTHKGPIPFQVYPSMSVNMLSLKVEKEFNISSEMQKWVLGRNIVTNLSATLSTYGINNSGCPIFLYVLSSPHPSNSSRNSENINKPINDVTKTNGNLSDDDDVYESLRSPAMMPYVSYDAKMEQSLNSKSNTLPRKAVNSIDKESSTNFTPLNSASYSSNSIDMAIGQTFGSTGHSNLNANTVQHASNQSQSFVPSVSLANSVNLMKNYYYQEGEIPFANQLIFEGLSLVNELLPRVEEEDEDDLEDEEDEITAKNVNGITDAALNEANQIPLPMLSTYQKLVELEDVKCVLNVESFECPICFGRFKPGEGVVLRECLHTFCRDCLRGTIEYNEEVQVKCPFRDDLYSCDCTLQDREIKELASFETYERYLKKSISVAEKNVDKSFHCKSTDCPGWCVYDDNVNVFNCPVCAHQNCINCQAIHEGSNCRQYQEELEFNASTDEEAKKTKIFLEDMLKREEALRCPQCKVIVMKKWGCDWVKCCMCDTEICWVTKGFRWGPKGKGDLSGGCRCMVNGQRCHPNCKYCH